MDNYNNNQNMDIKLKDLGKKLEEILIVCEKLKDENLSLKQQQSKLIEDRASLLQKNDQVRVRVEAMISKIKAMEQS